MDGLVPCEMFTDTSARGLAFLLDAGPRAESRRPASNRLRKRMRRIEIKRAAPARAITMQIAIMMYQK